VGLKLFAELVDVGGNSRIPATSKDFTGDAAIIHISIAKTWAVRLALRDRGMF